MFVLAAAAALLAGASADAQQYPLRLPAGTAAKPQRGTTPPPHVEAPEAMYPANPLYSPVPIAFTYLPAIVMSDGTVWANFGHGYVQVRTACRQPRQLDSRGFDTRRRRQRETTPCYARNTHGSLVVVR